MSNIKLMMNMKTAMQVFKKNQGVFLIISISLTLNVQIYQQLYDTWASLSLMHQNLKNNTGIIGDGLRIMGRNFEKFRKE